MYWAFKEMYESMTMTPGHVALAILKSLQWSYLPDYFYSGRNKNNFQ